MSWLSSICRSIVPASSSAIFDGNPVAKAADTCRQSPAQSEQCLSYGPFFSKSFAASIYTRPLFTYKSAYEKHFLDAQTIVNTTCLCTTKTGTSMRSLKQGYRHVESFENKTYSCSAAEWRGLEGIHSPCHQAGQLQGSGAWYLDLSYLQGSSWLRDRNASQQLQTKLQLLQCSKGRLLCSLLRSCCPSLQRVLGQPI